MAEGRYNDSIIELWGRAFTRARQGLDEEQVKSFVYELLSENHLLTRQQERLSLFNQLAERDVRYSE